MSNQKNGLLAILTIITASALIFAVSTGATSRMGQSTNNNSLTGGGGTTFNYTGAPQTYIVPPGVTSVSIEGIGAQGGSVTTTCAATGGRGANMVGTFAVTPGEVLTIVVGQQGRTNGSDAGGGGGTYVVRTGNVPLLVAGGGGGATNDIGQCRTSLRNGLDASVTTSGTASGDGLEEGGINGNGGGASVGSGGGGGGFLTDGVAGTGLAGNNGKSYLNGSAGGNGNNNDGGGYGGGGAGWFTGGNGGGGGGYSGGATSGAQPFTGGGGGGSYNIGTNQSNSVSTGTGDGMVTITPNCAPVTVNFNYTGAVQTWTVPPGVTSVNIQAFGAQGGVAFASNANNGGSAQGDLAVTPGETLSIYVGGQGAGLTGGFNGGGDGETGNTAGAGGGGASDIRQGGVALTDRKIVAGGGGGGGSTFGPSAVFGGPGGGLIGENGYRDPSYAVNPGGVGGNQSSSGTGTCVTFNNPIVSGGFGFGGTPVGASCGCDGFGGGGGWYGGSGSGNCRGAGGGSSYIGGVTSGATSSGVRSGNGLVTITFAGCGVGANLTGTVTMANAPATLIPDVVIAATGATPAVTDGLTNNSGVYTMTGFGPDSYTITPSKSPYPVLAYNGIFSNDATLISRHVVGLNMLSPEQLRAAKVAGLPNLSSYDAALLAQYIVGVTNPINKTGTWTFTPASTSLIVGPSSTADFAASLMGDVNGDWVPPGSCRDTNNFCRPAPPLTDPERIRNAVHASLKPTKASTGSEIVVAFSLDNLRGKPVDSFQFDIEFDPNLYSPAEIAASLDGTLASNMSIAFNSPQKGLLKVVVYGAFPASGDGVYVNLRFRGNGNAVTKAAMAIRNFRMNDGNDDVYTVDRRPKVAAADDGTILR